MIAQANAQWRQNTVTLNTAAQNVSNMEAARAQNGLTSQALDQIWQKERDIYSFAFTELETEKDRAAEYLLADKKEAAVESAGRASFFTKLLFGF